MDNETKKMKKYIVSLLGLGILSTSLLLSPYFPKKLNPERYRESWKSLESCLNIKVKEPDYYSVRDKRNFFDWDGYFVFDNIYLKEQHINSTYPVRHEQLHAMDVGNEEIVELLLKHCTK